MESDKYFGAIRSPVSGNILRFNERVPSDPPIINRAPYEGGWIAELECAESHARLLQGTDASSKLKERIGELKIKCFKKLPDLEIFAIGTECAATLVNLNELLSKSRVGIVVHVVSDDPIAEIEMVRWADQTKQELLETRQEGALVHFIVEKLHD